ncbi:MAG: hypothetical protein VXU42_02960, partial [Verrucomicrobiota bacterium]|nr:hypothetical protein [Verrucomicrobiota bacterium]
MERPHSSSGCSSPGMFLLGMVWNHSHHACPHTIQAAQADTQSTQEKSKRPWDTTDSRLRSALHQRCRICPLDTT